MVTETGYWWSLKQFIASLCNCLLMVTETGYFFHESDYDGNWKPLLNVIETG